MTGFSIALRAKQPSLHPPSYAIGGAGLLRHIRGRMRPDAPSEIVRSTPTLVRALRAHLAAHNFRVAVLSSLTLLAAVALWYLLYLGVNWLALLFSAAVEGTDARAPAGMGNLFWFAAAALLVVAWIDRRLRPDDRPRDHKSIGEIIWEFALAIPRLTLSVGGTLSAWQHLDRRELVEAVFLIERLSVERRLRLNSMALEIPNAPRRFKILFALQLVQVIDIRREDRELWVALNPLRPAWIGKSTLGVPRDPASPPDPTLRDRRPACAP